MKIEYDKLIGAYSYPISSADLKKVLTEHVPSEILAKLVRVHFGCNQDTTQEARVVCRSNVRGHSYEIRINFCLKDGKTKFLTEKRDWPKIVESFGGIIDKSAKTVSWTPIDARKYATFLIFHEIAHIEYAQRHGCGIINGKTSASEESWCESYAKSKAMEASTGT